MKGHAGTTLLLLLLVGFGVFVTWRAVGYAGEESGAPVGVADAAPVAVEVAPIESGTMREVRSLSGTLEASTRFDVAAEVGGLIESIGVDIGDDVSRNQVIAQIQDAEYEQAVAQAEAELAVRKAERAQAESDLRQVQRDYDRIASLRERGVASSVEYDEATANLESGKAAVELAEARVRQADAALELARIRLGYTTVRANWEGEQDEAVVAERYHDAGNNIGANQPLVSIVCIDPLHAVISITERDYSRLEVGQTAALTTDAVPGRIFEATINRISPVFNEASRQARVELAVANTDRSLKPGVFVRVRMQLREEHADSVVPLAALTTRDGRKVVFVIDEHAQVARLVPVQTGIVENERVQVFGEGLQGRVVVLGQQLLADGSPVRIHEPLDTPTAERDA